jgi:hypothetical protein
MISFQHQANRLKDAQHLNCLIHSVSRSILRVLIASEKNLTVDEPGFEAEMQQQKNRSRAAGTIDTEDWIVLHENGMNDFVGYDSLEIKSKVTKYRKVKAKGKEAYQLVLEVTPFTLKAAARWAIQVFWILVEN